MATPISRLSQSYHKKCLRKQALSQKQGRIHTPSQKEYHKTGKDCKESALANQSSWEIFKEGKNIKSHHLGKKDN